jgi:hypothetical protein
MGATMAEVTTLSADSWCLTDDVRDDFNIEIQNQEPDFERRIEQATRRVRAWYVDATGQDAPDTPPDLLRDATSLLAASLAHQKFAQNISGTNDGDERHVFLEDAARDTFEDWKASAEVDPGDDTDGSASDTVSGKSGVIGGADRSPIWRGD